MSSTASPSAASRSGRPARHLGAALPFSGLLEGRASALPNLARMYSLGMDTIAGAKLLQLKFGPAGVFQPDEAVIHEGRRARFVRISDGAAIIRYCGDSRSLAVPPESLSLPPDDAEPTAPRTSRPRPSSGTISRILERRSSAGVANRSLSRTARRRLTIV